MTALVTDSRPTASARLAGSAVLALQSDDRLVRLVRAGHERAFDAIVERYRTALVRFCARILPESRCEDAVQQAFINAHAALTASDEAVQLKPWLFAITRNAALNMLRQNGWNYDQIPLDFDGVRRPDQVVEQRIELQQTVSAVNQLPERQRDAIVMRELEGRSYDEIALALGTGDGAVRQLLNRARVTLRSAASMLVPPPLVMRAASALPPSDGRRIAEILGGLGAAGVAKAGATVLVAGSLVVGAVEAPIGTSHKVTREKATLSADDAATRVAPHRGARSVATSQPETRATRTGSRTHHAAPARGTERRSSDDHRGSSHGDRRERSSGGGSDDRARSGGSDGSTSTRSGSDDRSGSGTNGGGSDDAAPATTTITGGSDGGTSGTSGSSGPGSGSGDSSSGSSGSGSSGTSGSSGSGSSGTSGSGSSGSSGSGSDDLVQTTTTATSGPSGSDSGSSGSGSKDALEH